MVDEEEDSGGKMDWTIATVLSVAFHAALLGAVWMFSDRPGDKAAETETSVSAPARTQTEEPPATPPTSATPPPATATPTPPPAVTPVPPADDAPSASVADSPQAPSTEAGTYVVRKGDFLSRIANKCNCTVAEIKALNNIKDPNSIRPGQVLKVPARQ